MTRIIGGTAGGRRIDAPGARARGRPATACGRRSSRPSSRGAGRCRACGSSTSTPAPARSGLEAWSRGAGVVTLVEQDRRTAALISANARTLGFPRAQVARRHGGRDADAAARARRTTWSSSTRRTPRSTTRSTPTWRRLAAEWLVPGAMVVVERSSRSRGPRWPDGFTEARRAQVRRDDALVRSRRPLRTPSSPAGDLRSQGSRRAPCRLPRVLRPGHPRSPRHRRPRLASSSTRSWSPSGVNQSKSRLFSAEERHRDARARLRRLPQRPGGVVHGAADRLLPRPRGATPSSRACAPSATSTTSCRWRR